MVNGSDTPTPPPTTFPGICAAVQHSREAEITHCPRNSRNGLCDGRRISVSDVLTRSLLHRLAKLRVKFGQDLNFSIKSLPVVMSIEKPSVLVRVCEVEDVAVVLQVV
jgi:hypothetical protein